VLPVIWEEDELGGSAGVAPPSYQDASATLHLSFKPAGEQISVHRAPGAAQTTLATISNDVHVMPLERLEQALNTDRYAGLTTQQVTTIRVLEPISGDQLVKQGSKN